MNAQWTLCIEELKQSVAPNDFATWAPQLQFVQFADDTLVIGVPSNAFVETMWPIMGSALTNAIHRTYGNATRLKFSLHSTDDNSRSGQVSVARNNSGDAATAAQANVQQHKPAPLNSNLNPEYTFETFVEGRSNRTARTMAESIANNPHQVTFNPFFLYGPSGVGKTHLVGAIGMRIKQRNPNLRVLFVAANVFRTQYTDAVVSNKLNDFIHFYQTIDVLIIDDFQEITTAKTQQAFFHIFNHLHQNNHKIIITCDRPPALFEGIEDRMLTRLKWGAVTELERPDLKLRKDILQSKLKRIGMELPRDVIQYIADNVSDNVRELEGTINSLMAFSIGDNCDIDLELARRVVARLVGQSRKELSLDAILTAVCEKYHAKARDITGKSRKKELVALRQLVMFLTHKYTTLSLSQIGRDMGGRDHSTVLHSCDMAERRLKADKAYRLEIEKLEATLKK
ncbi:MAG: chromosomal replication initiator protein DnaA [Bacteroidales bacterium]|nr:chromosomal replication initiator protein DnaA [Bacteroidales bacterium]